MKHRLSHLHTSSRIGSRLGQAASLAASGMRLGGCALSLALLYASHAGAAETLIACGDSFYPPFTYVKGLKAGDTPAAGATIEGVGPDVLKLIFGPLGISVETPYRGNWKRCQVNVENGEADVMMSAYRNDERIKYSLYTTTPMATDPQSIFVMKGKEFKFEKWPDLIGKKAGIPLGFSAGEEFDAFMKKNIQIDPSPDRIKNYMKLEAGRIDFEPNGLYAGLVLIKDTGYAGKIVPLKTPLNTSYVYLPISMKSKYASHLKELEEGLKKLTADGTIDKLIAKHMAAFGVVYPVQK